MDVLTKRGLWLLLALLVAWTTATPIDHDQILLSRPVTSKSRPFMVSRTHQIRHIGNTLGEDFRRTNVNKDMFRVNLTFDGVDLTNSPNRTMTKHPFFEFKRFNAINTTASAAAGLMDAKDTDSAASEPNVLRSIKAEHQTPAVFNSDKKTLESMGFTEYFDFVGFTVKTPRANASFEFGFCDLYAWEIDGKHPVNVHELGFGFYLDEGYAEPWEFSPREFFEGWGDRVNYVEMSAGVMDEEYNEYPWEIFMDNIIVDFHSQ